MLTAILVAILDLLQLLTQPLEVQMEALCLVKPQIADIDSQEKHTLTLHLKHIGHTTELGRFIRHLVLRTKCHVRVLRFISSGALSDEYHYNYVTTSCVYTMGSFRPSNQDTYPTVFYHCTVYLTSCGFRDTSPSCPSGPVDIHVWWIPNPPSFSPT